MSLIKEFDEQHAKLAAVKAAEAELTDGPDAALKVLGAPTDPIRMRMALGILIRADRHRVAIDLVRDKRADDKWIHLAVFAFAFVGEVSRARFLLDEAEASRDLATVRSSRLAFAEGVIAAWRKRRPHESLLELCTWPDEDVELARTVIEILDPLLASVRANRTIIGDYELEAVQFGVYCAWIARDREFVADYIHWLVAHVPVPLIVAELCLRGLTQFSPEALPNRLRVEHAGEFQASFLAAIIERELCKRPQDAFDALVDLALRATTAEEKESICIALFETCGRCGSQQIHEAMETVAKLNPDEHRIMALLHVMRHLADYELAQAKEELEACRDEADGVWWQAQAQLLERAGDQAGAAHAWEKASELVPHPNVVQKSIKASIDRRRYESAIRGLNKLLQADPNNENHLKMVAWSHAQLGDHAQAAQHLKRLVDINASNRHYRIWLAHSLAHAARSSEAIEVLKSVCDTEDPPLEAILFQSELLATENRAEEAFALLKAIAPDHWDDPRFLFSYMNRGHAAGQDRLAHEAFARLLELRREGKVAAELLQEGTLEQLLERQKNFQSQRESLQHAVIAGRMAWLFAEDALGNSPAWAWDLHTQELKWLAEDPLTRAAYSVYATNGFIVPATPDGRRVTKISAPPPGTRVVVDLSALLTLYKLGLLQQAADYFGAILVPSEYGVLHLRDADRFGQHQPSRESELKTIRHLVERGQIRVDSQASEGVIEVDEYSDDQAKHVYRLNDLISLLKLTQKATAQEIAELSRVAHKPSTTDSQHPGLALGDRVIVSLMTLRTLASQPVFGPVLNTLSILMRSKDYEELLGELRAHDAARAARQFHDGLWHAVADLVQCGKIVWQPVSESPVSASDKFAKDKDFIYLDGVFIAQQLRLPLLVDDRVLQVLLSQDVGAGVVPAFGCDCLIEGMAQHGKFDVSSAARAVRQLMNWRYRFLVPSADVLVNWAHESADNLPGPALLDAAFYLHDCLRDPGLHCGLEQSEPPTSMAVKYVIAWMTSIVSFLARIWGDERFSEETCGALTRWVGEDLVPSCPRGLWYQESGNALARGERGSMFGLAMIHFTGINDLNRANRALRMLAASLGIGENQYVRATADAILASVGKEHEVGASKEAEQAFTRRMMQNALHHAVDTQLDGLEFARFRALGLFSDVEPPSLPGAFVTELQRANQSTDNSTGKSPLIFMREEENTSVTEVESILIHPDQELRNAAFEYLRRAEQSSDPWLTPHTFEILKHVSSEITSPDEKRWLGAGIALAAAVREDVLALLASLRQSLIWNYREGIDDYLSRLIHPSFATLANFRPPTWNPTEQRQELRTWIHDLASTAKLGDALTAYVHRCGFVPLSYELSASHLVVEWMAAHPEEKPGWTILQEWVARQSTPVAQYHAVTIALRVPQMQPTNDWDSFWSEVVKVLNVKETADDVGPSDARWELCCALASHYVRHIEALHPGQHGDVVSCYAWWLAVKVASVIGHTEKNSAWFAKNVVLPQGRYSYFRWTVARSPVVPSPMRYGTLQLGSVWAVSLLTNLASAAKTLPEPNIRPEFQEILSNALHSYLLTSPIAQTWEGAELPFALQENGELEDLCRLEGYVPNEVREHLGELIAFRRHLSDPGQVKAHLDQFLELPAHIQLLVALALRDIEYSTTKYDGMLSEWLEKTKQVSEVLAQAAGEIVDPLVEMLAEFQQHQVSSWHIRLPHLLAYVIEGLKDGARTGVLATHALQLSANAGLGSPIQRLANSRTWAEWASALGTWRANLQDMASRSEPWVASRVRSISATVSRLIGPDARHIVPAETEDAEKAPGS